MSDTPSSRPPIDIGDCVVLLLDDHIVSETSRVRLSFHSATKDPANPVIAATEPWEGRGPYVWNTHLLRIPKTGQYRLYYIGFRVEDNHYRWGLAVSDDGIVWTKPELGIEIYDGRLARNQLTGGPHPDKAVRTVVIDPRLECPVSERYKGLRFTYDGIYVSYSPDGERWTEDPGNPVWQVASDAFNTLWDERRQAFVAYYKVWEVCGETPDASYPGGFRPVVAHYPTFTTTPRSDGLIDVVGPLITFNGEKSAGVVDSVLTLKHGPQSRDDGGGASLTGVWYARRVQAWAQSTDWRSWSNECLVLQTDDRDRPDANIQNMFVLPYGVYYLAFLTLHDDRGHFEQQLAFSVDGLSWKRPWRGNFIGLGHPGAFDCGMAGGITDPVVTDTQLLFYYGGFTLEHHKPMTLPWTAAIGRATLRRDGFASWDSLPDSIGVVTTQLMQTEGRSLWINADAEGGEIRVDAVDENGRVIPGFTRQRCEPLRGNSTRFAECLAPVGWGRETNDGPLFMGLFRLRFYLKDAQLFSFKFAPSV